MSMQLFCHPGESHVQVSPKAFAPGQKGQEAGEISLQGTAIEKPEEGTPSMPELKHIYYRQMIRFYKQSNNYLEVVRSLLSIYQDLKSTADQWQPVFKQIVWCASSCSPHASALLWPRKPQQTLATLSSHVSSNPAKSWPQYATCTKNTIELAGSAT